MKLIYKALPLFQIINFYQHFIANLRHDSQSNVIKLEILDIKKKTVNNVIHCKTLSQQYYTLQDVFV